MKRTMACSLHTLTAILCSTLLLCMPVYADSSVSKTTADSPHTALKIDAPSPKTGEIIIEKTENAAPAALEERGPGIPKKKETGSDSKNTLDGTTYLGTFTTTGYCNCVDCSSGHNLTASGTVPNANHTIAADPSRFPFGTKLMINGTIYTVEDRGVYGDRIDIYYSDHESAWGHGLKQAEVYLLP